MQTHTHHVQRRNAALDLGTPVVMPAAIMQIAMDGVIVCYERMPHPTRRQFWQLQTLPEKIAMLAQYAGTQPAAVPVV